MVKDMVPELVEALVGDEVQDLHAGMSAGAPRRRAKPSAQAQTRRGGWDVMRKLVVAGVLLACRPSQPTEPTPTQPKEAQLKNVQKLRGDIEHETQLYELFKDSCNEDRTKALDGATFNKMKLEVASMHPKSDEERGQLMFKKLDEFMMRIPSCAQMEALRKERLPSLRRQLADACAQARIDCPDARR
jgi:hypothetical protein